MFTEDLSAFMNVAEFATSVTLSGVTKAAIFDAAFALGSVGPFGMASNAPTLTMATADVPANPVGLSVVAGGVTYSIVEHQPDGTGISTLQLRQ